jgi:hypothetical protein
MATISETELQRRLKRLESSNAGTTGSALIVKVGDHYEYASDYIYVAYASNITSATNGIIASQDDATDFQQEPFDALGDLLSFRGFYTSRSVYASGDPTDYTWGDVSLIPSFATSERYYHTSFGLLSEIGDPTTSAGTWTLVTASSAVPGEAVWIAERFTINDNPSAWSIFPARATDTSPMILSLAKSGFNQPTLGDATWIADVIIAATAHTGRSYSNQKEIGYGTAVAIDYDNGKLFGVFQRNGSGQDVWVTPTDFIDGDLFVDGTILADKLVANTITAGQIAGDTITANEILGNTITAAEIFGGTITTDLINTDGISANKINVNDSIAFNTTTGSTSDPVGHSTGLQFNKTDLHSGVAGVFLGTHKESDNSVTSGLHIGNLTSYVKITSEDDGSGSGDSNVLLANTRFLSTSLTNGVLEYLSSTTSNTNGKRVVDISSVTAGTTISFDIYGAGGGGASNEGTTGSVADSDLVTYNGTAGSNGSASSVTVKNGTTIVQKTYDGTNLTDSGISSGGLGGATGGSGSATGAAGTSSAAPDPNADGGDGAAGETSTTPIIDMEGGLGGGIPTILTGSFTKAANDTTIEIIVGDGGNGGAGHSAAGASARSGITGSVGYVKITIASAGAATEIFTISTDKVQSEVDVVVNGNVTADEIIDRSDVRLKTDISPIRNALEIVKDLEGVVYTRIDSGKREAGVIAQDVEEVFPYVVSENSDGYLGVAYGRMVGLLIEAVKDLSKQIEELKKGD